MTTTARKGQNRIGLWIIGGAVVITAAIIVLIVLTSGTTVDIESEAYAGIPADWINGTQLGDPEAPVVLEAYEDFLCPHCGEFNRAAKDRLVEEFVIPGKVKFVYKFFPLEMFAPNSFAAARAGQCVATLSDNFWLYHDSLFFGERGASRYSTESLTNLARSLGIRENEFVECIGTMATQEAIDQSLADGVAAGVTGTPSLFINGEKFTGNVVDYDAIKTALNAALQP